MMRARHNGKIVYRHMPGLLRVVRGRMYLTMEHVPALARASFTATFTCDTPGRDDPLPLHDAHLVHADEVRLVPCEGSEPEASRGPAFPG
jgi:hypothetical protein